MNLDRPYLRVDQSHFAMVPRADIPRSTFRTRHSYKTTFDPDWLIPIHVEEVLPGDSFHARVTIFARLNTLLFPLMDELCLETFFFFCPNRLLWTNWKKFQGERPNPADSISFTIPQLVSPASGFVVGTLGDYFGLPTVGQVTAASTVSVNALPLRAYNLIYNEWFRDQNLTNAASLPTGDGPDGIASYVMLKRAKKHDYFTSALPWPLKGGVDVTLPLSGSANIKGIAYAPGTSPTVGNPGTYVETGGSVPTGWAGYYVSAPPAGAIAMRTLGTGAGTQPVITADLSTATGATINALRLAIQTQRLLERDARSGTRYTELLHAHFGVRPQDARLQRPEYIGGGKSDFQTSAIPQTSATGLTGGSTPFASLGAQSLTHDTHGFTYHAPEHGYIIGLANVRAPLTYQQGLHRMWTRQTRYDFYMPVFSHLGEQAIRNDEIYATGSPGDGADTATFGYQERWAEYRYYPSRLTGLFRSTSAGNVDEWHLAQQFSSRPALNDTFITSSTPTSRVLAGTFTGQMIIFDSVFDIKRTRVMPMFSVPGMMDHF